MCNSLWHSLRLPQGAVLASLVFLLSLSLGPLAQAAEGDAPNPASGQAAQSQAAPRKLNVLLLVSDDLNCELGCYGASQMKTPHIDALARRGVRFDRAYCQYPLCNPSRASFLTGRRPDGTGVYDNAVRFRENISQTVTLPELFKQNGYFVARIGKLYHYGVPLQIGTDGLDDPQSWTQVINPRGIDREVHDRIFTLTPGQFGGTLSWLSLPSQDEEHTDGIAATEVIRMLEKHRDEPFFLAAGFYRPHTPYVAPTHYFDKYPLEEVRLRQVPENHRQGVPAPAFASHKKEQEQLTDPLRREAIQAYQASISLMDAQVGRVMEALDRLGLAENTVVVFVSDHGYHLGEHGLWQKQSLFEESARVPLIVAAPGAAGAGQASPRTVEMIDIYPTLAELCGLQAPGYLDGASLAPLLVAPQAEWNKPAITQVRRNVADGYALRTERYRYIEWSGGDAGRQLYDHQQDPEEYRNLAELPEHAATVGELSALLKKHVAATHRE